MTFRRLYWVTEDLQEDGKSSVHGVFTSIPDLIERDLSSRSSAEGLRLNLVKLDGKSGPLRTWEPSSFRSIETDLEPFVKTEEFSTEHCTLLANALNGISQAKV